VTEIADESDRDVVDEPFNFKQLPDSSVVQGNLTDMTGNDITGFPDEEAQVHLEDIKLQLEKTAKF